MSNKKKKKQMETLVQLAKELEAQEQAIHQKSGLLEDLRLQLAQRERSIAAAEAAVPENIDPPHEADTIQFIHREKASDALSSMPKSTAQPVKEAAAPDTPSAAIIEEIQNILKTIFLEYSTSVHQINSQISTITASTMCAAVTSVLENRNFNAKDAFIQEMQRILKSDPVSNPDCLSQKTSPAEDTAHESHNTKKERVSTLSEPTPVTAIQHTETDDEADDEDNETELFASAPPLQTGDDILRIGSVIEFQKLSEHGFRNDDTIVRVELPKGIQYIPRNFFYDCSNLKEVWLPDSLLEIGPYSFYGCRSLETVHIGPNSAFAGDWRICICHV